MLCLPKFVRHDEQKGRLSGVQLTFETISYLMFDEGSRTANIDSVQFLKTLKINLPL